jgi:hypothetical protein
MSPCFRVSDSMADPKSGSGFWPGIQQMTDSNPPMTQGRLGSRLAFFEGEEADLDARYSGPKASIRMSRGFP